MIQAFLLFVWILLYFAKAINMAIYLIQSGLLKAYYDTIDGKELLNLLFVKANSSRYASGNCK